MNRENKFFLLTIVLVVITLLWGCISTISQFTEKEKRLSYRVTKFHEDMKAGDFESNWDMFSSEDVTKRPNKNIFLMQSRTFPKVVDYRIEKIEINENKAMIKKYIDFKIGNEIEKELYYDCWIYENNEWYIVEGFRTKPGGFWDQKRE